jgi:manganese transport protein
MIALLVLSRRRDVMGAMAASTLTMALAIAATCATLGLNALLLAETIGLPIGL